MCEYYEFTDGRERDVNTPLLGQLYLEVKIIFCKTSQVLTDRINHIIGL